MGYNARSGHGYGNQKHSSGGSRFSWRKPKKPKDVINVKEEPEPKVEPETVTWTDRPLPEGVKVFLSQPTTFTNNAQKRLLPSDISLQSQNAYQIGLLAANQKLSLEVVTPNGQEKQYRIIKTSEQQPQDKPLAFSDYVFVGNIKNALRTNGYTVILK